MLIPLNEEQRRALLSSARLASLGLYMGLSLGLCTYLGMLADERWDLGVTGTLIGFALGTTAAFYGLFRELQRLSPRK